MLLSEQSLLIINRMCVKNNIIMLEKMYTKKAYERPLTEKVCVEVESNLFASSVTEYENAGSAGEGGYQHNGFDEFGSASVSPNSISTDSFDEWGSY